MTHRLLVLLTWLCLPFAAAFAPSIANAELAVSDEDEAGEDDGGDDGGGGDDDGGGGGGGGGDDDGGGGGDDGGGHSGQTWPVSYHTVQRCQGRADLHSPVRSAVLLSDQAYQLPWLPLQLCGGDLVSRGFTN